MVPAEVVQVGSDQSKAGILESARGMGLPVFDSRPGSFQTKKEPEIEE